MDSALEFEVELQPNMIHLLCANFRASAQEIEVFQRPAVDFVHLEVNWELELRPGVKLEQQLELELKPESALESDVELQPSMIHSLGGNFRGSAPSCCLGLWQVGLEVLPIPLRCVNFEASGLNCPVISRQMELEQHLTPRLAVKFVDGVLSYHLCLWQVRLKQHLTPRLNAKFEASGWKYLLEHCHATRFCCVQEWSTS